MRRYAIILSVLIFNLSQAALSQDFLVDSPVERNTDNTCGIKCCRYLLGEFYQCKVDLTDLVRDRSWELLQDGVTVKEICIALQQFQIKSEVVVIDPTKVIESDWPCICLLNNPDSPIGHFVVLGPRAGSVNVDIWDNGILKTMPTWQFCQEFSGIVILPAKPGYQRTDYRTLSSLDSQIAFTVKLLIAFMIFAIAYDWLFIRSKSKQHSSIRTASIDELRKGFSLLELIIVIAILGILISLLMTGVQKVRSSSARIACQNQFRQVALGTLNCHDLHGAFPAGLSVASDQKQYKYMGWTARILPFVDQKNLWSDIERAYRLDKDPDRFYGSPYQNRILGIRVGLYQCPIDSPDRIDHLPLTPAYTWILGVSGRDHKSQDGVFFLDSRITIAMVTDGTSNTIMMGERPPANSGTLGWWYRGWGQNRDGSAEMVLGVRESNTSDSKCRDGPYSFTDDVPQNPCSVFHFWSLHRGGANFAFADGSVRFLSYSANDIMPALATRAGGEVVSIPE